MRLGFDPRGLDWNYKVGIGASRQGNARKESNVGDKIEIEVGKNVIYISQFINDCSTATSLTLKTIQSSLTIT